MMLVYPLTTHFDLRLARKLFKFGLLEWGHHHWTVGVVSPTRRRPGMRQHKPSVPHLHRQEKGCTPTATCEARAAINKSEHGNAVHHLAHTPQEFVLRGDSEGNPKCGLKRRC
ncbi:hypothetical protein EVAR_32052_1 [Eumeta japonica]|uniref:Uncharacterized protein n=1 Tax=Eumeta variegata TaxID=151549 RepID=A0A4C1WM16_EUMVA|nr:hypothetical protein EVAR_32052_1 [Eumeta japonica]